MSFILSLIFVFQVMFLAGDMFGLQIVQSEIDAIAQTVGYRISQSGTLNESTIEWASATYKVTVSCLANCSPRFGDTMDFKVSRPYVSLIISKEPIMVGVVRSAVIGYYY